MGEHFTFKVERLDRAHGYLPEDGYPAEAFALTWYEDPLVVFEPDGQRAYVAQGALGVIPVADLLRWAAPAALAMRGIVCIHGAAHRSASGGITAVVGYGGAGKSTLVRALAAVDGDAVLDDLLRIDASGNVDVAAERIVRSWSVKAADDPQHVNYAELAERLLAEGGQWEPVRRVALLGERLPFEDPYGDDLLGLSTAAPAAAFDIGRVHPTEAVALLGKHRFGGHPCESAWAPQLRALAALGNSAAVVRLSVPDGLERLHDEAPEILRALVAYTG